MLGAYRTATRGVNGPARNQNVSAAAREAKIDRKHLRDLLRKLGLREPNDSN